MVLQVADGVADNNNIYIYIYIYISIYIYIYIYIYRYRRSHHFSNDEDSRELCRHLKRLNSKHFIAKTHTSSILFFFSTL